MHYKVTLHRTDEGISVSVPALPGCWSEGETEEEALENIRDAIREYLAALGAALSDGCKASEADRPRCREAIERACTALEDEIDK